MATTSTHSSVPEILLHEIGHSFANLADEYWAGDVYAGEYANMTSNSDENTITWKDFLGINDVGIYPYEESPSWYRPHQNCKMRYLGSEFCEVCKNEIEQKILTLAPNDDEDIDNTDYTESTEEITTTTPAATTENITPTKEQDNSTGLDVEYIISNSWETEALVNLNITNNTSNQVENWKISFDFNLMVIKK
jgi:hypothetical protein